MDPRLQRRVQRYGWDRAVVAYEAGWRDQLEPAHSLMLDMAALRPGEPAIDRVHARHVAQLQQESLSPGVFADWQRDLGQPLGGGGYHRVPVGQHVHGTGQQVRRSRHVKASVGP